MKPFAPARIGHHAVRDSSTVVGNTARWPLENNPRGLYPVRSRWQRPGPMAMPAPRPGVAPLLPVLAQPVPTAQVLPFKNLLSTTSTTSSAPLC